MRRGDVVLVNLEPVMGSEANKLRPCILVSNNGKNMSVERQGRGTLTVVPVTSNTTKVYPFQALLPAGTGGLKNESKAQAEQIRTIDVSRISHRIGHIDESGMRPVDQALRHHLALVTS